MQAGQFHPVLVDYLAQVSDLCQAVMAIAQNSALDDMAEQYALYCVNNAHAHLLNCRQRISGADQIFAVK